MKHLISTIAVLALSIISIVLFLTATMFGLSGAGFAAAGSWVERWGR
jgi:hypothetical protein